MKKYYSIHLKISQAILIGAFVLGIIYALHWSSEHLTSVTDPMIGTHITLN